MENPNLFKEAWRAGHFYSVLPGVAETEQAGIRDDGSGLPRAISGIDARDAEQLALLTRFATLAHDFPYLQAEPRAGLRYQADNKMFAVGDGLILHCFLRHFRPKRVVEVGSGFSSALTLDTNEFFLDRSLEMTFIEPYPERLDALLRAEDRKACSIHVAPVQGVPLEVFSALEAGDLLFIDSSHVGKTGSDLLHIIFEILPRLPAGCLVHFHDIFWPFEYPLKWYKQGRAWNEAFFLRTLLSSGSRYEILFHNHFMAVTNRRLMADLMPVYFNSPGGSIYLRKK